MTVPTAEMDSSRRSRAPGAVIATLVAAGAIALLASRPASPITPQLAPDAGALGFLSMLSRAVGLDRVSPGVAEALSAVFMFSAAAAFLYALRRAWRGALSARTVIVVGLALHVIAFIVPLLFSRDVYSYTAYGRIVSEYGANPYVVTPDLFPNDPIYPVLSKFWLDSPSVYGPAFTALSAGVTSIVTSPASSVLAFKGIAAVASALTMILVVLAARRVRPERAAFAGALVGWNPVVVFHGVGGGHNDALVGLSVAGAVLLLFRGKDLVAGAVLVVGALVKAVAVVPWAVLVAASVLRRPPGKRLRALGGHLGVAGVLAVAFAAPFFQTTDPTLGQLELATRQGWLAPSRFVRVTLERLTEALGVPVVGDVLGFVVRVAFPLIFLGAIVAVVRHLARDSGRISASLTVTAMGWASLIAIMTAPLLLPWYVAWLVPLVWLVPKPARLAALLVVFGLAITELVAEPSRSPGAYEAMVFGLRYVASPIVLIALVFLLVELRRRLRSGPAPGDLDPLMAEDLPRPVDPRASEPPGYPARARRKTAT